MPKCFIVDHIPVFHSQLPVVSADEGPREKQEEWFCSHKKCLSLVHMTTANPEEHITYPSYAREATGERGSLAISKAFQVG